MAVAVLVAAGCPAVDTRSSLFLSHAYCYRRRLLHKRKRGRMFAVTIDEQIISFLLMEKIVFFSYVEESIAEYITVFIDNIAIKNPAL